MTSDRPPASSSFRISALRSLSVLASLLAFGCSAVTAPSVATSSLAAPSADEFALRFAHATCDRLGGCCRANGLAFEANSCLVAVEGMAQAELINPARAAGATYDPVAATACLADVAAAAQACDDALGSNIEQTTSAVSLDCARVYAGTKAPGETCASTYECAPGPEGSTVSCVSWLAQSAGGLATSSGQICQVERPGTPGAPCSAAANPPPATIANCQASGLTCGPNGTCRARLALGATCEETSDCSADAWCASGVCSARLAAGGSCEPYSGACGSGLYCSLTSATCVPLGSAGAACSGNMECSGTCDPAGKCTTSTLADSATCGG